MKRFAIALRGLVRSAGYSSLAVFTLAVGIACCTAVFGLLDAIYLRPIPIRAPDELLRLELHSPKATFGMMSYDEYRQLAERIGGAGELIAIGRRGLSYRQDGESVPMIIHYVSGNYFGALGIPLARGRGLTAEDDSREVNPRVVINYSVWMEQLGGRENVIDSTIRLNDTNFTIVGVTAKGFLGLSRLQRTNLWVTVNQAEFVLPGLEREVASPFDRWFDLIARSSDHAALRSRLQAVLTSWQADNPEQYNGASLAAGDYLDEDRADHARSAVFLALVGLVLLVTCANVANLTLARGESRSRELSVRAALGAGRARLLADALTEAFVLALIASLTGLLLVSWLIDIFQVLVPQTASGMVLDVRIDHRLLLAMGLMLASVFTLVGVLPAWKITGANLWNCLKEETRASTPGRGPALRDTLVIAQIALSVVVVIAAGMLFRSLRYGEALDPGFDTSRNVATFYLLPPSGYSASDTYRFLESARLDASSVPSVHRASYAIRLPAQANESGWATDFTIPGKQPPPGERFFRIKYTMVGPDYFQTMGTRIVSGRGIDANDGPSARRVVVINETMSRRLWPGENPVGKQIQIGREQPENCEIVGVAQDNKIASLYEDPQMYVYVPFSQDPQYFALLLVQADGNLASVQSEIRRRLVQANPEFRLREVSSVADHMKLVLFEERRDAGIAMSLSVLAVFISVVGVYGVVVLVTRRRIREIGIRMALGATRKDMVAMAMRRLWRGAAAGIGAGIAGGWFVGRMLQTHLHGVNSFDPWSTAAAAVLLFGSVTAAGVWPTWRAAGVDPTDALHHE